MSILKQLPKNEQPQEKIRRSGADGLSEAELLSLILGTGDNVRKLDSLELSRDFLARFGSLHELDQASLGELATLPGMGQARAVRLKAALELGRRLLLPRTGNGADLSNPAKFFQAYGPRLAGRRTEVFMAVLLDIKLHWIRDLLLAEGSLFECVVKPRDVFSAVVREAPASVVFLHNHPSGDPTPSEGDRRLTERLYRGGESLGVRVVDHIVIGKGCYYSFMEHDELERRCDPKRLKVGAVGRDLPVDASLISDTDVFPDIWCRHDMDGFDDEDENG